MRTEVSAAPVQPEGLETLDVRLDRHTRCYKVVPSKLVIAWRWFQQHPHYRKISREPRSEENEMATCRPWPALRTDKMCGHASVHRNPQVAQRERRKQKQQRKQKQKRNKRSSKAEAQSSGETTTGGDSDSPP